MMEGAFLVAMFLCGIVVAVIGGIGATASGLHVLDRLGWLCMFVGGFIMAGTSAYIFWTNMLTFS